MTNPTPIAGRKIARADINALGEVVRGLETAVEALEASPPGSFDGDPLSIAAFGDEGQRADIPFVTPQMFGAVADNATDCHAAFVAALDYLRDGRAGYNGAQKLFIPKGDYYLSDTLDIRSSLIVEGEGTAKGIGITTLRWPAGKTGIRVQRVNTDGAGGAAISPFKGGGDGTLLRGLYLKGGYAGTESESHGIHLRAGATIEDCQCFSWPGNGIHIDAGAGTGLEGNANCFQINRVTCVHNRHGLYTNGADANAGFIFGADCRSNRAWGIWDSSFLGNVYVGCHSAANGWDGAMNSIPTATHLNNFRYAVVPGQEEWCSTNPPTGTATSNQGWLYISPGGGYHGIAPWVSGTIFRSGGAYRTDGSNQSNVFVGCYSESDQNPSLSQYPSLFLGGLHGAGIVGVSGIMIGQTGVPQSGGWRASDAGQLADLIPTGVRFNNAYGLQTLDGGVNYVWTILNSSIAANWAFQLCGDGTSNPVGPRKLDFPNGHGLGGKKVLPGTAAPTTGTYAQGDRVINTAPSAGGNVGWVCVTGGSPGTWKSYGTIAS